MADRKKNRLRTLAMLTDAYRKILLTFNNSVVFSLSLFIAQRSVIENGNVVVVNENSSKRSRFKPPTSGGTK